MLEKKPVATEDSSCGAPFFTLFVEVDSLSSVHHLQTPLKHAPQGRGNHQGGRWKLCGTDFSSFSSAPSGPC